jgi:PKD repeat protein
VRDAASNPVAGVAVSIESSGTGNTITPASANTEGDGVARFTFSSTVAEEKTITATAGGVTITDQAIVTVQKATSVTRITRDEPDRSTVGDVVTVEYRVTGPGGTPTGTVTITASDGNETCSASVEAGQCDIKLDAQGNPRVLTATYSGDARFNGSTDTENHRVDAPVPNNPPTAAFEVHCEDNSLTCDFTSNSHDTDGQLVAFSWDFGDPASGANNTSTLQFPSHDYSAPGSYTVTLTVTDNDQATDSETRTFTVTGPPANTAPIAVNDEYSRSLFGGALVVPADQGVLANDTDDNGPLTAKNASDPANGSVALNPDGSFTYTPDGLSLSPDTFTYEVTDGEFTSTATVTITTTP